MEIDDFAAIIPPGPAGPQGVAGVTGPAGPVGPIGPAGLNWQGAWSALGTYVIDDAVGYGGASWFCIDPVGPSATNPSADPTNWALLAAQGANGATGATGLQGPTGATGPAGSLIPHLEYNVVVQTVWNNGRNNIASNTSFGDGALAENTSGNENTALGSYALLNNLAGFRNTALGYDALYSNNGGDSNVAVGSYSLYSNVNGFNNTAVGHTALQNNSNGAHNTAVGQDSLSLNTGGIGNTTVGSVSLQNTTGNFNSALGYAISSGGFSGSVLLGVEATATSSNQFVVGSVGTVAGTVVTAAQAQTKYWNVVINGVPQKILLG
jgi:hypothetical protein